MTTTVLGILVVFDRASSDARFSRGISRLLVCPASDSVPIFWAMVCTRHVYTASVGSGAIGLRRCWGTRWVLWAVVVLLVAFSLGNGWT